MACSRSHLAHSHRTHLPSQRHGPCRMRSQVLSLSRRFRFPAFSVSPHAWGFLLGLVLVVQVMNFDFGFWSFQKVMLVREKQVTLCFLAGFAHIALAPHRRMWGRSLKEVHVVLSLPGPSPPTPKTSQTSQHQPPKQPPPNHPNTPLPTAPDSPNQLSNPESLAAQSSVSRMCIPLKKTLFPPKKK